MVELVLDSAARLAGAEFEDIQGIVRFGHGQLRAAVFWLLRIADPTATREWLGRAPVTSAVSRNPLPDAALQVAFTAEGLRALGLPGSVMAERRPRWIDNVVADPNFLRAAQAESAGIIAGLAVPVFGRGKIAAVLEFFTFEPASASAALLQVMEQIGVELGQVFERKWAEKKLRESERLAALGITTATIIHEIGNPLQLISGLTYLLQQELSTEAEKKETTELADDLKKEIDRLISLLAELRFAASPGLTQLDLKPINLPLFAVECLMKDKFFSAYPGIRLEHDLPPDLPPAMMDKDKMRQVLLNLYKNAVEAMPDGGTLSLRAFQSSDRLCLDIADTGSGIPKDVNVFEPAVTTKPHGMGLGLMVVQQIISAHRGSITYTSDPGHGTVFRISLPIAAA
jgi:signal transduction histidine kinase